MEIQESGACKKKGKTSQKKVRFAAKRTKRVDPKEEGGAIRKAALRPVKIDKKKASFTRALYDLKDDEPDYFQDVENSMYSHYGGQISGRGSRHDPPHVQRFVHHTLKHYPKILDAYHKGRVVNPPLRQQPVRPSGRGPDIVDYGGSLDPISHSENGRLVTFDSSHTAAQHFSVRYR